MRHAKAEPAGSIDDKMRPLALNGRRQATLAGQMLTEQGLEVDLVLVSGALRTRQTWELLSNGLELDPSFAEFSDDLYLAHPQDLLNEIHKLTDVNTVLVVGHEPTMSALAAYLGGPESDMEAYNHVRFGLQTSAYAVVESPLDWAHWSANNAAVSRVDRPTVQ